MKVINAIHKPKKTDKLVPVKKLITGVWKDIGFMDKVLAKMGINIKDNLKVEVVDGGKIKFWKDSWCGNMALKDKYPNIYKLVTKKDAWVKDNYDMGSQGTQWGWDWCRNPSSGAEMNEIVSLIASIQQVKIGNKEDQWMWSNNVGDKFSIKELRKDIVAAGLGILDVEPEFPWSSWAPFKISCCFGEL